MIGGVAACAWAAIYAGAAATALVRGARRIDRRTLAPSSRLGADVVLVRPCAGDEPGLTERLAVTGGVRRIVLAVASLDDGAAPAALTAASALRARERTAEVVATRPDGPNFKADQLARAVRSLVPAPRVVVVADSDVVLAKSEVAALVAELDARGDAVVWAPPVPPSDAGVLARAVLEGSMHAFPVLAGIDGRGLVGKLFAIRKDALDAVGGFEALTDRLGEDMELARRLRERGLSVSPSRRLAPTAGRRDDLSALLERLTRWILVIRAQRSLLLPSYPLLLAAAPLALSVIALGLAAASPLAVVAGAIVLAMRSVVALAGPRLVGRSTSLLAPLGAVAADVVLMVAFVRALATTTFHWRGRRLRVARGGHLARAAESEEANGPREESLGGAGEDAGPRLRESDEAVELLRFERAVDARERRLDRRLLQLDSARGVAFGRRARSDRDPKIGPLRPREHVAHADRHDTRAPRDASDQRRPRPELEPSEGRSLRSLRVDPDEAPGAIEEARRMADRAGPVGGVVEVDPEGAHLPEERESSEVRRIHHRERVALDDVMREPQGHERIPPAGVVRHDHDGPFGKRRAELVETRDEHAAEGALDARARVAGEPAGEPAALSRRDHGSHPR